MPFGQGNAASYTHNMEPLSPLKTEGSFWEKLVYVS